LLILLNLVQQIWLNSKCEIYFTNLRAKTFFQRKTNSI